MPLSNFQPRIHPFSLKLVSNFNTLCCLFSLQVFVKKCKWFKGIGDGLTSEAKPLPILSLLHKEINLQNKNNQKPFYYSITEHL